MTITPFKLEGLQALGYTRRQSEFLFLVATHSGYFISRQFNSFARAESGSVSHAFVQKLLERRHGNYRAYRAGSRVYHLFARKLYRAIERENLRTRRKHELDYIKTRLVALDFVLENSQHRYLETEGEKVAFFEKEYNISRETLPAKMYRSRSSREVTPRYFVDRFPMFVDSLSSPAVVTFTYMDGGAITLDGFGTHLLAYMRLFRALPRFEFLYMAPSDRLFRAAESEFYHVVFDRRDQPQAYELLNYFRIRKAWDLKERVVSADVVYLRQAQTRYIGKGFDDLYERWRQGVLEDRDVMRRVEALSQVEKGLFRAQVCGSSLKVFSDPRGSGAENCTESDFADDSGQASGQVSTEVSEP
jgi:hypothetical protein